LTIEDGLRAVRRRSVCWLIALPVCAAAAVFLPVLQYPFIYDEFIHFYNLVNFGTTALLITPHGGHLLFFSNLVYLPLYRIFGLSATAYYTIALVTHLVNVALCYRVAFRLTGRPGVAVLAATLWGCAAMNLGAIGWFAVYGQLLVAMIVLLLLQDVARLAAAGGLPSPKVIAWWAILLVAACGSFGNGLCIAALFLPVATFMLDASATWRQILVRFGCSVLAVAILYLTLHWLHLLSGRAVLYPVGQSYGVESLSLSNAVLFVRALLASAGSGVGNLLTASLLHFDSGKVVAGPLRRFTWKQAELAVLVALVVWLAGCAYWLRHRPHMEVRRAVGLGVLALGCYGMVSARTALSPADRNTVAAFRAAGLDEGILRPITRVTAPRYQYLPSLLLLLVTVVALPPYATRSRVVRTTVRAGAVLWAAVSVWLDGTAVRAQKPGWHPQRMVENQLRREVGRFPLGSTVYVDNGSAPIPFNAPDEVLPGRAAIALLLFPQFLVDGRRVYFVEHDASLLNELRSEGETPISHLLIGPSEVPSDADYIRTRPSHVR
jgi:hypothetical protein